jgi:protein-tyrosine phosphatase/membrane-associated phospholipid phosphatase
MGNVHGFNRATQRQMKHSPPRSKAAIVSAGLSILFLVVYGSCNWITAHRAGVGSLYFAWERVFPFVPLLIPAYLSLDLFFIGAPFLCRTEGELRGYLRRIAAAILIAGLFFLLFPLRFAFPRPETNGLLGTVFDWFRGVDAPYNLLPSLHAALLLLVAAIYMQHLRGTVRVAALCWFLLIGISPILTYQHHLIDIIGGFILAGYCFYFFPDCVSELKVSGNSRLGIYYGAGAVVLATLAPIARSWGLLLLWPATALAIVSVAYFGRGPAAFRKTNGRLPWSAWLVLAPCLLGQSFSRIYYRRRCRPWDPVTSGVWIGAKLSRTEANAAIRSGVTAVLDLTAEFSEVKAFRDLIYRNIPVLDLTAPTQAQLHEMARFIGENSRNGIVYVHCKIGFSRSAAAVAAYLIMSGQTNRAADAFAIIKRARPSIIIRPEIFATLDRFESDRSRAPVQNETFVLAPSREAVA